MTGLAGNAVLLRDFEANDVDDLVKVFNDTRVTKWLSFDNRSRAQCDSMLSSILERARNEPRTEWYFAVETQRQVVGFVRLGLAGVQAAKLGYAIAYDHWGKGLATDGARTIIGFAFESLGLHRISAAIGPENSASIKVAERLKMKYEGRLRDHVFTDGAWRDSLLFSILIHEFKGFD